MVPKKTYGKKATSSLSSQTSKSDESEKENIFEDNTRQSKTRALKKIQDSAFDEPSFNDDLKSPPFSTASKDPFDSLLSSPVKNEVKLKPLSFWTKKLNDIESKEKQKNKKRNLQLYEFSDSDPDSDTSNQGKRNTKQKPKTIRQRKKKQPGDQYHLNKNYLKNRTAKKDLATNRTKEGPLIRERINFQKEKEKLLEKENQFTFNADSSALGITSTPGRNNVINIVGPSNFSFFSPIRFENTPGLNRDKEPTPEPIKPEEATPAKRLTRNTALRSNIRRVSHEDNSETSSEQDLLCETLKYNSCLDETSSDCRTVVPDNEQATEFFFTGFNPDDCCKATYLPSYSFSFSRDNNEDPSILGENENFLTVVNSSNFSPKSDLYQSCLSDCPSPDNTFTGSSSHKPETTSDAKDSTSIRDVSFNEIRIKYHLIRNLAYASRESTMEHCVSSIDLMIPMREKYQAWRWNSFACCHRNDLLDESEDGCSVYASLSEDEEERLSGSEAEETEKDIYCNVTVRKRYNFSRAPSESFQQESVSSQYFSQLPDRVSDQVNDEDLNFDAGSDSSSDPSGLDETTKLRPEAELHEWSTVDDAFHRNSSIADINESHLPLPVFESTVYPVVVDELTSDNVDASLGLPLSKLNVSDVGNGENEERSPLVAKADSFKTRASVMGLDSSIGFNLMPGKKWSRAESVLRKVQNGSIWMDTSGDKVRGRKYKSFVEEVLEIQSAAMYDTLTQIHLNATRTSNIANLTASLSTLAISSNVNSSNKTIKVVSPAKRPSMFRIAMGIQEEEQVDGDVSEETQAECLQTTFNTSRDDTLVADVTPRDVVLQRCCQTEPVPFEKYFNKKSLKDCKKIGEGVYGEVFLYNSDTVIKIIPIEGPDEVNGEPQKKFEEILSEIEIAMELSNLRKGEKNATNGFSELKRCWCVQGKYPEYLLELWEDFDTEKGSENDSPIMFKSEQLYIVLELANGGKDLEAFVFNNAEQSLSILMQTAYSLAVAEKALAFEHRDMHWGNVLITATKEKNMEFLLDGVRYQVPTKGVKVNIIDFTLSRMYYEGCCIFNDLSIDPGLFTSHGDYQFDIYRMMQTEVNNDWSSFKPATNLFWLHYTIDKMIAMVRYKNKKTKVHVKSIGALEELKSVVLGFSNSAEFALSQF